MFPGEMPRYLDQRECLFVVSFFLPSWSSSSVGFSLAERSGDFSMEAAEWQTISQPAKDHEHLQRCLCHGGQSYRLTQNNPKHLY